MSAVTEQLMRRAEELATLIQEAMHTEHPDSVDYQLLEKALPLAITVGLLLKGTTDEFKATVAQRNPTSTDVWK